MEFLYYSDETFGHIVAASKSRTSYACGCACCLQRSLPSSSYRNRRVDTVDGECGKLNFSANDVRRRTRNLHNALYFHHSVQIHIIMKKWRHSLEFTHKLRLHKNMYRDLFLSIDVPYPHNMTNRTKENNKNGLLCSHCRNDGMGYLLKFHYQHIGHECIINHS